jgi:ADP-ribose pyrophosphatase
VDEVELCFGEATNGQTQALCSREVIEHRPAVGVLAVTKDGSLLLTRQYRYAAGERLLEICAGLVEPHETPLQAAMREAQEELGVKPGTLAEISELYTSPGFCTEALTLFLASDLRPSSLPQDADENVETVEVPEADIDSLLSSGGIRDMKTFAALCWYRGRIGSSTR